MTKKFRGVMAGTIASFVITGLLTSCGSKDLTSITKTHDTTNAESTIGTEIVTPDVTDELPTVGEVTKPTIEAEYMENVEIKDDAFAVLERIYKSAEKSYEELLKEEERSSSLYISSLLMKLRAHGLSDEVIKAELNNVAAVGPVYLDFENHKWELLVGNLNSTVEAGVDTVDYYYPLAAFLHLYDCKCDHTNDEQNRVYCDNIHENLFALNESILFTNYAIDEIKEWAPEIVQKQLSRLLSFDIDYVKAFNELDNMYLFGIYPMDLYDEWEILFGTLNKTVGKYDNIYDYYYDLACFVHELRCEDIHKANEFNRVECDTYKLKFEY